MDKSPDAFRTISEVADMLDIPAHVLRFWETRFPQIRPVKRAGGRRYYRPNDIALLTGIKRLLHDDGLTIRGVQKMLREQGVRHVSGLASCTHPPEEDSIEAQLSAALGLHETESVEHNEAETAQIIALETVLAQKEAAKAAERAASDRPQQASLFGDLFGSNSAPDDSRADEPVVEAPFIAVDDDDHVAAPVPLRPAAAQSDDAPAVQASSDTDSEIAPDAEPADSTASADSGTDTLRTASRLRALPSAALTDRSAALHPLRQRLVALRARLADGARKRPR